MKSYQSTAAQASFITSLATKVGTEAFNQAYARAAAINSNAPRGIGETTTQAARRLSKKAASALIEDLKTLA